MIDSFLISLKVNDMVAYVRPNVIHFYASDTKRRVLVLVL